MLSESKDKHGYDLVSSLAGTWYNSDAKLLHQELEGYLSNVDEAVLSNVCALISPHAGYRYSGQTAAFGMKQIAGKRYSRVIVMGPSHQIGLRNAASVTDAQNYVTPLGKIPIDTEFINALKKHPCFKSLPAAHETEHSVQIQLPFLQTVLKDFSLVPIIVGQLDDSAIDLIAETINQYISPDTLVVASTDFTHYGFQFGYLPFRENAQENLKKLDMGAFEFVKKKDPAGFNKYIDKTGATICGCFPVSILLAMLPKNAQVHLLKYTTSGELTGDYSTSVSYVSAAITGRWQEKKVNDTQDKTGSVAEKPDSLTEKDKEQLLKLARQTLEYYMENRRHPTPDELGIEITPAMQREMGAFVTLHIYGQLRGCIGEIFPRRPLYEAVMDHSINSALHDTRFMPVKTDEIPELEIEISALSPPESVASYKDIIIGKHGVVLSKLGLSAVFLPQVAPEQGWGLEETLAHLSIKAGLPADAWQEGASFEVFEAVVFGENHKKR